MPATAWVNLLSIYALSTLPSHGTFSASKAAAFALAGAVMTYFGFMHGEAVGIGGGLGVTPGVALAYAVMAAGLFALAKSREGAAYSAHAEVHAAAPAE